MKKFYFVLSLFLLLLTRFTASAQSDFSISGRVTNEKGNPLKGATVFIANSQRITACNDQGYFRFDHLDAGNYQLNVTMIGYLPFSRHLPVQANFPELNIKLKVNQTRLKQVNIGGGKDRTSQYLALFTKELLGSTINADSCKILNPEVINFSTKDKNLYADADEFLIIENKRLGYRIKYLLKSFRHLQHTINTAYNGDAVFEELPGTDAQKQQWAKNRLETYRGSMMHFFRAAFTNAALQEGFIVNNIVGNNIRNTRYMIYFNSPHNGDFMPYNKSEYRAIYVEYNPKKAIRQLKKSQDSTSIQAIQKLGLTVKPPHYGSELYIFPKEATVDARGNVPTGYFTTFLIMGDWIKKRVGDQLPFEYQPPNPTLVTP